VIFDYSFDDEISFPMSMVLEDYNSVGMDLQILLRQINFGDYLVVAAKSVILAKFIPNITSTAMVIRTVDSRRRRSDCSVIILRYTGDGTLVDVE
jgi:hypothetical protein